MLVRDPMVHVHRATEADARAIATLHANAERHQLELMRGKSEARGIGIDEDEQIWRQSLHLSSGDHRPWVAWRGDRPIGFVTVGPSRDLPQAPSVGEVYVLDLEAHESRGSAAKALLDHACHDLAQHGFGEVTVWVSSRDESVRALLSSTGWSEDGTRRFERVRGVPILEFRYRRTLTLN
jgi:RimJ/RimL family protein N-acetyltransferase